MALLDEAIFSRLSGFAGISALVGARVYPTLMPQKPTLPALVYTEISNVPDYVMGGQSGIAGARYQIDSYATSLSAVKALAEQVRLALSGFRGTLVDVIIDHVEKQNSTTLYEEETALHRVTADYLFFYRETLPSGAAATEMHRDDETPAGAINDSNTVFTLAYTPVPGSEMVFVNGLLQTDYTINGAVITFTLPLAVGDTLRVWYRS